MSIEKLRPSFTFTEDRLRELQQVVPEAFADGKINWDTLRDALGEHLEDEELEHFGLTWPGKREARRLAAMPSKGTLVPVPGEGINEEKTHNLFIEGDNLEVLKLLQKSYAGRIKMIYIDPPYNTGNDFVYKDDYAEPLESYLKLTGNLDELGRKLTTNSNEGGRFHSNWLSMMLPRLLLAKNLLKFDGNIFISIDDNEYANLKAICDEVFGPENFLGTIVRQTIEGGKQDTQTIQSIHEYLLIFAKNSEFSKLNRKKQIGFDHYDKKDEYFNERGFYYLKPLENRGLGYIASLDYPIIAPDKSIVYPGTEYGNNGYRWVWSKEKLERGINLGMIEFITGRDGKQKVYYKTYQFVDTDGNKIDRYVPYQSLFLDGYTNRQSGNELRGLFDGIRVFDYAKPSVYIKELIKLGCESGDIVLDFFCGSATTAHASIELMSEDLFTKFIMVQLQERVKKESEAEKAGFQTIAEIGKERIRRVITSFEKEIKGKLNFVNNANDDIGFKVFRLENSLFKEWTPENLTPNNHIGSLFDTYSNPLINDWDSGDLFIEIILTQGFPLDSEIKSLPAYQENTIQEVSHDFCAHRLYICLDEKVSDTTVGTLSIKPEDIFVCLDTALTDEAKLRLSDRCQLKVI